MNSNYDYYGSFYKFYSSLRASLADPKKINCSLLDHGKQCVKIISNFLRHV